MSTILTTSRPTKQSTSIVLIIFLLLLLTAQSRASVQWWISSRDMSKRLTPGPRLTFESEHVPTKPIIRINGNKTYQTMTGLGSSLEHSTCYNIRLLPPDVQEDAMDKDPYRCRRGSLKENLWSHEWITAGPTAL